MHTLRSIARMIALSLAASVIAAPVVFAQLDLPRVSPKATVSQTVGLTDITIAYCRPGVKGRMIWGGLVPYDQVWRTGANEATTITFSDDVTVDGKAVPAGTYGLFTLPGKEEWTIILNKAAKQWGAYEYKPAEDLMRFGVKPQAAEPTEWMTFSFPNLTPESADVALTWEKLRVSFTVKVDVVNKVVAAARKAVAEAKPDDWRTPARAAAYCLDNKTNLDEGMKWVEKSLAAKETYSGLMTKARYLANAGNIKEAVAAGTKAIEVGKAADPKADVSAMEKLLAEWKR